MSRPAVNTRPDDDPHAALERAFIEEFLAARGVSLAGVRDLPKDEASALLAQASVYASGRLTELESRAHYVGELHE